MNVYFYPLAVLATGLSAAQMLFTCLVFFSDLSLYQSLTALNAAGFVVVPNTKILPSLLEWRSAFWGGLFFTLTTGAGLSLAALVAVSFWRRLFQRCIGLWGVFALAMGLLWIGLESFLPIILACGLTLLAAGLAAVKFFPRALNRTGPHFSTKTLLIGHMATITLIFAIWVPRCHEDAFISFRDNLLLSHALGRSINRFYYQYTLYPAEVLKPLDQKLLKTCKLQISENNFQKPVARAFMDLDYLPVSSDHLVDLDVFQEDTALVFERHGKRIYRNHIPDFLKDPETVLETVSSETDHAGFLRNLTFYSLVGISPLLLYFFVHGLSVACLFFISAWKTRFLTASMACTLALAGPAFLMTVPLDPSISETNLKRHLASPNWRDRVTALRLIADQERPLPPFNVIATIAKSPEIPERYWAANVLGNQRSAETENLLLALLDDPHPNVACMALQSLGKQKNRLMIPKILSFLGTSDHWYVQWYAYKALKRLGWKQKQFTR